MPAALHPVPACAVHVGPIGPERAEQLVVATRLLHDLGLRPAAGTVFIADAYDLPPSAELDGEWILSFTLPVINTLWYVVHDLRGRVDGPVDLSWDGQELTFTFVRQNEERVRVEARPLSPGQAAFGSKLVLSVTAEQDPWRCAYDVPEEIAVIAAVISTVDRSTISAECELDDRFGLLEFADHLLHAGVCRWPESERRLLGSLAQDWIGSAGELLAVAGTLGLPRQR